MKFRRKPWGHDEMRPGKLIIALEPARSRTGIGYLRPEQMNCLSSPPISQRNSHSQLRVKSSSSDRSPTVVVVVVVVGGVGAAGARDLTP